MIVEHAITSSVGVVCLLFYFILAVVGGVEVGRGEGQMENRRKEKIGRKRGGGEINFVQT